MSTTPWSVWKSDEKFFDFDFQIDSSILISTIVFLFQIVDSSGLDSKERTLRYFLDQPYEIICLSIEVLILEIHSVALRKK